MKRRKNGTTYYTTLGQAAAIMEEDLGYLKWAKISGCPGFQSGRIYPDECQPWLDSHRRQWPDRPSWLQAINLREDQEREAAAKAKSPERKPR